MERRISDPTADEAGVWDGRLRSPDCTDDDRARFAQWRDASPEHREAFEKIQAIVTAFRNNMGRADVRALRDAALMAVQRQRRKRAWIAAAAVATLILGGAIWTTIPDRGIYETGIGQRSTVTLQDGSSVELNSATRIKVSFTEAARTVELSHGQALFQVAKNPRRPFMVRAADRDITAVGTTFDIRLDASSVRVTLLEGRVRVSRDSYLEPSAPTQRRAPTPARTNEIYLIPGQQFVAHLSMAPEASSSGSSAVQAVGTTESAEGILTRSAVVRTIDVSKVTGWRDGRIFLEDLTLAEAVAEMNKYSEVQILIDDAALAEIRINGMFRAGEQRAFVAALEQYFPITAQREGGTGIKLVPRH